MKRREFIAGLGGAVAWPIAVRAQQGDRVRRIGVLNTLAADDQEGNRRVAAFLQALQPLGWTIGRNVETEQRWGSGDPAGLRKNAEELVALAPDVILTIAAAGVAPLLQATRSVPIVFVLVADPVGAGFVDSLAHPGGNATGFMAVEYGFSGKWLELLKELAPSVTRAAVIRDPTTSAGLGMFAAIQSVAPLFGVDVTPVNVRKVERALAQFAGAGKGGLIVTVIGGSPLGLFRDLLVSLAAQQAASGLLRYILRSVPRAG
jgi:putative tryptophan/tyrosine transport system substrate-binding protein